jgi:hypothetical protein
MVPNSVFRSFLVVNCSNQLVSMEKEKARRSQLSCANRLKHCTP